ncbi:histamine H1 receptor [Tachyglossus aculeatus]|uniref:histamine H1 receptor n=1 Tax=Tachyglossus aculeatus TaxID=9261 RepID=UPI0018F52CC4|nr:histamine H1 receptor [Tachyglossus aculeatus]
MISGKRPAPKHLTKPLSISFQRAPGHLSSSRLNSGLLSSPVLMVTPAPLCHQGEKMCEGDELAPINTTQTHLAPLAVVLGGVSLVTVSLNLLVLYAVKTDRKLHTVGNLYIVSLSVADLIVGAAVMPLNIMYLLEPPNTFGQPLCLFWLSMDYVASTASIFSIFILCIDRYRSVQQPLKYLKYRTKTRASTMISGAWLLSLLWVIPILGWRGDQGKKSGAGDTKCETGFHKVTWFKVMTAIINFYLPTLLMLWFYTKIYRAVRRHCQHRELINGSFRSFSEVKLMQDKKVCAKKQEKNTGPQSSKPPVDPSSHSNNKLAPHQDPLVTLQLAKKSAKVVIKEQDREVVIKEQDGEVVIKEQDGEVVTQHCFPITIVQNQPPPEEAEGENMPVKQDQPSQENLAPATLEISDTSDEHTFADMTSGQTDSESAVEPAATPGSQGQPKGPSGLGGYLKYTWKRLRSHSRQYLPALHMNRERKAAKQLGFIMAAFIICWIPYFMFFMVIAFCAECCNENFHMFTIWLGYVNSTLNPLIYPLCNENFKKTFKKILHLRS